MTITGGRVHLDVCWMDQPTRKWTVAKRCSSVRQTPRWTRPLVIFKPAHHTHTHTRWYDTSPSPWERTQRRQAAFSDQPVPQVIVLSSPAPERVGEAVDLAKLVHRESTDATEELAVRESGKHSKHKSNFYYFFYKQCQKMPGNSVFPTELAD